MTLKLRLISWKKEFLLSTGGLWLETSLKGFTWKGYENISHWSRSSQQLRDARSFIIVNSRLELMRVHFKPENFYALLSYLRKPDRKWAENQILYEGNLKQHATGSFCFNFHICVWVKGGKEKRNEHTTESSVANGAASFWNNTANCHVALPDPTSYLSVIYQWLSLS